jgi:hypothetical protein
VLKAQIEVPRNSRVTLSTAYTEPKHCRRSHRDARRIPFTSLGVAGMAMSRFPRDLELVGLPAQRPLELTDLPPQLALAAPLLLPGKRLAAAFEQLVAPRLVQRVRDLVLPANVLHRPVAAQPSQHDLDLLLRRPAPVLPLLAQPDRLLGRAAILSRPPDEPSGATRLRNCPARQPSYLSTRDRGAGQVPYQSGAPSPLGSLVIR